MGLSLRPFNLILHFTDGRTEGLGLGDFQQVTWWLSDRTRTLISHFLTPLLVGREGGRGEKAAGPLRRALERRQDAQTSAAGSVISSASHSRASVSPSIK